FSPTTTTTMTIAAAETAGTATTEAIADSRSGDRHDRWSGVRGAPARENRTASSLHQKQQQVRAMKLLLASASAALLITSAAASAQSGSSPATTPAATSSGIATGPGDPYDD